MTQKTPTRTLLLIATALAAALALAGCLDGSGSGGANDNVVTIKDMKYEPATLTVPAGTTVTWENEDFAQHTVTPTDQEHWGTEGSGDAPGDWLNIDESWSFTFTEPGTYEYYCIPHAWETDDGWQGQVGKIIVE